MDNDLHRIYETYAADLYNFILRLCCDEETAKDILQETMLKALTSADRFQGKCSVKTWLCTIARNLWYDRLKSAQRREVSLETVPEPETPDLTERLDDAETAMHIHRLLHRLEEPYREVFTLRVFAELRFADIGSLFGKSENWAGVTYFRAKQKLIKMLKEDGYYDNET